MKTATRKKATKKPARKTKPKLVLLLHRETFGVSVTQYGPNRFEWSAQQACDCFMSDDPQPGDLDERGEAKTLKAAAQAAFDALADHLDIE